MAYVGARLRELRKARKLTQDQLAAATGIPRTDLSGMENDRITVGSERGAKLAAELGVSVLELLPEAEPDKRGRDLQRRLEELEAWANKAGPALERLARRVAALEKRDSARQAQGGRP